ncbi:MAG: DNA-binding transcriptional regulator [Anaerolineae bacterium]|nr:MAG: DNA-binding transcriptional regulator [Anaerolineae bacterium]
MNKLSPLDETRLLVKVSKLYYEEGLSQEEILARLHLSRSKISRLLQQAREAGIVQISVVTPKHLFSDLESRLERQFGLQEALVVESHAEDSPESLYRGLGIAAAGYLERSLNGFNTLGISWGATLNSMVAAIRPLTGFSGKVVQIIGGLGRPEAEVHATELCRRLARALHAQPVLLPAPGVVPTPQARQVLLADADVKRAVALFETLDLVFVGIGAPTPDSVLMRAGSILSADELALLRERGAVGDIALRFFDEHGLLVESEIDRRVVGITLAQLKQARRVVGVAGGPQKFQSIRAALRGGLLHVLITDSQTAEQLLR